MGYAVYLKDTESGAIVEVPRHVEGGTYAVGGIDLADISITYNYAQHFRDHIDREKGLRWLYGKTGAETIPRLQAAVMALGTVRDDDYWADTPGNAGHALSVLLGWARLHPAAVWDGD